MVAFGFLFYVVTANNASEYSPGQALTEPEQSKVIDIALNDPYVNDQITSWKNYDLDYRLGMYRSLNMSRHIRIILQGRSHPSSSSPEAMKAE